MPYREPGDIHIPEPATPLILAVIDNDITAATKLLSDKKVSTKEKQSAFQTAVSTWSTSKETMELLLSDKNIDPIEDSCKPIDAALKINSLLTTGPFYTLAQDKRVSNAIDFAKIYKQNPYAVQHLGEIVIKNNDFNYFSNIFKHSKCFDMDTIFHYLNDGIRYKRLNMIKLILKDERVWYVDKKQYGYIELFGDCYEIFLKALQDKNNSVARAFIDACKENVEMSSKLKEILKLHKDFKSLPNMLTILNTDEKLSFNKHNEKVMNKMTRLWNLNNLSENRHTSPENQQAYDKNFGLVPTEHMQRPRKM